MTESSCIIIHPQKLHSLFLYNVFVEYFRQKYSLTDDRIYLLIENNPMYIPLYSHKSNIIIKAITPFTVESVTEYVRDTLLPQIGLDNPVYGYEEFDSIRSTTNIYHNIHKTLYFNSLFSYEEVFEVYSSDFADISLLESLQYKVNLDRDLNNESHLLYKVQKIASVPYMVTTSDAFREFVYHKELTSINVFRLMPNLRNYFNLIKFINKSVSVVVTNDIFAHMIYFLQTHMDQTNNYLISPNKRVFFDLKGHQPEDFPFFRNPLLSSWSFETIHGHVRNTTLVEPTHFNSIESYASLLKIDASIHETIDTSGSNIMIADSEDGFVYHNVNHVDFNDVYGGISTENGGLSYPLPKYDLTLGVEHVNLSIYMVIKPLCHFIDASHKTLFSYGQENEDFTVFVTPRTSSSQIGISLFNDISSTFNRITYTPDETILCYASLSLHNYDLVTQLTSYNVNDITQIQNKYYKYDNQLNLPSRGNDIEIGTESDCIIYHFEVVRGVIPDDEKNTKIASLIDTWKTTDSNLTNPNDVDIDIYDEFGVSIEPTLENHDSQYTNQETQIHLYGVNVDSDQITLLDGIVTKNVHMNKIWVFAIHSDFTSSNVEDIERFTEEYLEVGIRSGFYDSFSNVYHRFTNVETISLQNLTLNYAFDDFSTIEPKPIDYVRHQYRIGIVVQDSDNTYLHKLFHINKRPYEIISDLNVDNKLISRELTNEEPDMTYKQVLTNGDIVYSHNHHIPQSHKEISSAFTGYTVQWDQIWWVTQIQMIGVYVFSSGPQRVSRMKFMNPSDHYYTIAPRYGGDIHIEWWNGTSYEDVVNPSSTGLINFRESEVAMIDFEEVVTSKVKVTIDKHSESGLSHVVLGEWTIYDYTENTISVEQDLSWDQIVSSPTVISNFIDVKDVQSSSNVLSIEEGYLLSSHNIQKYWVFAVNATTNDINSITDHQLENFMENYLIGSSFTNTYYYGENERFVDLAGLTFDYAFENLSTNTPINLDTYSKQYFTVVVLLATNGKYVANLDQFITTEQSINVISNNVSGNNHISNKIDTTDEPDMDYKMILINGDVVYANNLMHMERDVAQLFSANTTNWGFAWIGESSIMKAVYEFTSGDQYVSQMKFKNIDPGGGYKHFAGNIDIEWWNGHKYILVTNPSLPGFTTYEHGEEITIDFDIVYSSKFKITLHKHAYNDTTLVGLAEWTILDYTTRTEHVSTSLSWNL